MDRLGELSEPDLRSLIHGGDVANAQRRPVAGLDHGVVDIPNGFDQPYRANIDLLQSRLNEAAAGIHIVVSQLLFNIAQAQAIRDELVRT